MKVVLGDDQKQALAMMIEHIDNDASIASLVFGSAGTGKSLLINNLVGYLEKKGIPYCLCAPTHKAALVMSRYTKKEAITLHKLLSLSPNLRILELDLRKLLFLTSRTSPVIPDHGVIICDEASMINDDLYELLLEMANRYSSHICFFGDFRQLSPVEQQSVSKIIKTKPQKELTKIYRQSEDNGLMPVLNHLRGHSINHFEESPGITGSLEIATDFKDFITKAEASLRKAIKQSDILETKITAYTNARVDAYNTLFHKQLFGDSKPYRKSEFLTCGDNLEFNNFKFFNSMDYVIITEPERTELYIPNFQIEKLPGWRLELYDSLTGKSENVSILEPTISKDYLDLLAEYIEELRINAIELGGISKLKAKKAWSDYYKVTNSFTTPCNLFFDNRLVKKKSFSYGYASTVHKLQGSNYNNIFVDMRDILTKCRGEETRRQLEYVALSRTRNNAIVFQ